MEHFVVDPVPKYAWCFWTGRDSKRAPPTTSLALPCFVFHVKCWCLTNRPWSAFVDLQCPQG